MANLNVQIWESIDLGSGKETHKTAVNISDINQVLKRRDTIVTDPLGPGIEILSFTDSESTQTAGSFVKSDVKYMRITNLDATNTVEIYLIPDVDNNMVYNIEPKRSIIFPATSVRTDDYSDYVTDGYTVDTFFTNFTNIVSIKAKALNAPCPIEYFVAST
jgi:hypothetical protein